MTYRTGLCSLSSEDTVPSYLFSNGYFCLELKHSCKVSIPTQALAQK